MESIYHSTRHEKYRFPKGAVPEGTEISFSVDAPSAPIYLCYSYGLYSFTYSEIELSSNDLGQYQTKLRMQGEPGLFFYWFRFLSEQDRKEYFYVRDSEKNDGSGRISDISPQMRVEEEKYPAAFQVTVFAKDFRTPDWFKGALLYQIFPDRFFRGSQFSEEKMQNAKNVSERMYHQDWYEEVDIEGKPETGYLACDFFGGTLEGIAEKSEYLASLHIDCLYLNPIFEARSNHRYDTSDYLCADPMLGGNEGFHTLSHTMKKENIRILLDGVFSHTGADSVYFNKLSRYPEKGAYEAKRDHTSSIYSSWYTFTGRKDNNPEYASWWGFPDLPNVNENDLSYKQFILGNKGVLDTWLQRGAFGFRLDVSDELPDSFLRELRKSVKAFSGEEGVVVGEVWEDASNKVSYGSYRDFLFGNTHDSVMGYTFRNAVLGFLSGQYPAERLNGILENYRENYPPEAYYCIMNLISSHDVVRAATVLSGDTDPGNRQLQKEYFPDEGKRAVSNKLLRLAFILQMGYIGSPSIYYGDEIGMEGFGDPFNRRTYPWERLREEQESLLAFFREYSSLRKKYPVLRTGEYATLYARGEVFIFERTLDENGRDFFRRTCEGKRRVIIGINKSQTETYFDESLGIRMEPLSFIIKEN